MAAKVSQKEANFRRANPGDDKRCGNCVMFRPATHECTKVMGLIHAFNVCKYFYPKTNENK